MDIRLENLNRLFLTLASLQLNTKETYEGFYYACLDGTTTEQDWCADRLEELARDSWHTGEEILAEWDYVQHLAYTRGYLDGDHYPVD